MGLLSIIRKQKLKDREVRILVLGLDNCGKSTIVHKMLGLDTASVTPTMGFQIHQLQYNDRNLRFWDIGGQNSLRSFWSNYYDSSDVVIWVIDATSVHRLKELYGELREKVIQQDQLKGVLFVVMINKVDLLDNHQKHELLTQVSDELKLGEEVPKEKYMIQATSGITGEGLQGVLDWMTA